MKTDLSRIHLPGAMVLCAILGFLGWLVTRLPAAFWAHVDWTVATPAIGAATMAVVGAFTGPLLKKREADGSAVPPVPAGEAKRRHLAMLRGEEDDDVDQEAPTRPGGGT